MLRIVKPEITSEKPSDIWMAINDCFFNNLYSMLIKDNNNNNMRCITSRTNVIDRYHLSTSTTTGFVTYPSHNCQYMYGNSSGTILNGYVCDINSEFINNNFKLLSTNYEYNPYGRRFVMTIATVDTTNYVSYGFTSDYMNASFLYEGYSDTAFKDATCKFYNSDDTAYAAIGDLSNFIIFAKLKPINPSDDPLYVILMSVMNFSSSQNNINRRIYLLNKYTAFPNMVGMEPSYSITSSMSNVARSDTIVREKFVYNNRWYSDDIYIIRNTIDTYNTTAIEGVQYTPLGHGLFLKSE